MNVKLGWIRRRMLALGVAALCLVAISGTALAGHQEGGVKSYTGCLVSGDGVLIKIKEGNAPKSACSGGQVEAHFSGGDITEISVGNGLTSTPNPDENGEVRIELAAGQTLPSGCAAGRIVEWNGSAWICGVDNDTTYSASTGLDLSAGNAFSIEPAYRLPSKACTTAGEFARGFDATGAIQCAAQTSASIATLSDDQEAYVGGEGIPDDGVFHTYASISAPAGTYFVLAKGVIESARTATAGAGCQIARGGGQVDWTRWPGSVHLGEVFATPFTLMGVTTGGATIELQCSAVDGADGLSVAFGRITALKVG
jgi:hypothetical protein